MCDKGVVYVRNKIVLGCSVCLHNIRSSKPWYLVSWPCIVRLYIFRLMIYEIKKKIILIEAHLYDLILDYAAGMIWTLWIFSLS